MKKKILFVCIGNLCRSPMAEAMARKYGSDILEARSAGLMPSMLPAPYTRSVLAEKNVDLGDHVPRHLRDIDLREFDLIVNLSGSPIGRNVGVPVENWNVADPMGKSEDDFRQTRETLEMLVMRLVLRARLGKLG